MAKGFVDYDKRLQGVPGPLWTKIANIDELKGQWVASGALSPQILGQLKQSVLITSAGASTRIEGAKLSDDDVERLMRGLAVNKFTDRDQQEVRGYFELLENIFDSWKTLSLSENLIQHFHQELLKYVEKDSLHRGNYKKTENTVIMIDDAGNSIGTLFQTTPAYLTAKEMQELVEWTKQAYDRKSHHPLLILANFVIDFLNIHPFQDGNGRMSRVLTNFMLLKQGYLYAPYVSQEKIIETHKVDYYVALRKSQKTFKTEHEDIAPWLDFFLSVLLQQAQAAIDLLTGANIEMLLSPKQLAVWRYLQQVDEAAPGQIQEHTAIARATVNQALDKLVRLKKVEVLGQGRATRYRVQKGSK